MANPSMIPPGPGMAGQAIVPGSSGQMHPRVARPTSQTGTCLNCHMIYHFEKVTASTVQKWKENTSYLLQMSWIQ